MQLFLITYRFTSTAYCFAYYLLALYVKLTYALLIDIGCACVSYRLMSFALFYFFCHLNTLPYLLHTGYCHYIQFCSLLTGLRLLHAYYLHPCYCLLAKRTLQLFAGIVLTDLFLPYWQALLTHSARLHGILLTAYYLLTNYYLFAYSYNTLNNHANITYHTG